MEENPYFSTGREQVAGVRKKRNFIGRERTKELIRQTNLYYKATSKLHWNARSCSWRKTNHLQAQFFRRPGAARLIFKRTLKIPATTRLQAFDGAAAICSVSLQLIPVPLRIRCCNVRRSSVRPFFCLIACSIRYAKWKWKLGGFETAKATWRARLPERRNFLRWFSYWHRLLLEHLMGVTYFRSAVPEHWTQFGSSWKTLSAFADFLNLTRFLPSRQ